MVELDRDYGLLPISIGTSIPFENITGMNTGTPTMVNDIDHIYINVHALVRNIYGSFKTKYKPTLTSSDLYTCLEDDINRIVNICNESDIKVTVFNYDYSGAFPAAKLLSNRPSKTPKQVMYDTMLEDVTRRSIAELNVIDINSSNVSKYKTHSGRTLLITIYPYDLIWNTGNVKLLESHTGNIKSKKEWSSKLNIKKELRKTIPFNFTTLCIYGDKNLIMPDSVKYRRLVSEVAVTKRWHTMTTIDKVNYDISSKNIAMPH